MSVTVTVGNTVITYPSPAIREGMLGVNDTLDGRSTATFTVYDPTGTLHFSHREQVLITDSLLGPRFSGYVSDVVETNIWPQAAIEHAVTCFDQNDLAVKRVASGADDDKNMSNQYAGDDVVYLIDNYLAAEGVTAPYARQFATSAADFATGDLAGVIPASNVDNGDLELAPSGVVVSKTESSAANWNAGTLTGVMTNGNLLQLNAHPALSFSGVCSSGYGNAYAYYKIWAGAYVIQSGDKLRYKVWINSGSPAIQAGVDAICTDGTSLRDFNSSGGGATGPFAGFTFDQNGLRCHPNTDLSGFANDQWYERKITFQSGMNGKTISYVDISFEGDNAGTYQAYFYDVWIESSTGTITQNLFGNAGVISAALSFPNLSSKVSNVGYANIQITPLTAYESSGTRISQSTSVATAGIYKSSLLTWQATVPSGTALAVFSSIDGGSTYQAATNFSALSGVPAGASLTNRTVTTKMVMTITGKDPTATPQVSSIAWTVLPSYAATKADTFKTYDTQANWNSGTLVETLATSGGDLTINSSLRNWDDLSVANQTLFGGGGGGFQSTIKNAGSLRASTTFVARSRLDFAGTWQNFIMSIDVQVPAANTFVGVVYRTTYWDNLGNTEAYLVDLSTTSFNFGRGTNSVTNTHTNIQTQGFSPAITAGDWHTITIIVNGSTHNIFLDGVNYWGAVTDATFSAAGNFGLRNYNNSGGDQTCYYDNFGVMPIDAVYPGPGTFSGPTWTSASIPLGSFRAGPSLLLWDASTIVGDYLNIQTNFNGAGYQNATNGAAVPGIVAGTAYSNATLQVKVQMQAATAADTPVLHGLTAWVVSQYSAAGSRISPGLSLSNVGRAGSTLVAWNALVPPGTTLFVDTSPDKINWTNVGSGAQGGVPIAGISTQPDLIEDTFSANTSFFYTPTSQTDGTPASWIWDTANSRLTASGGTTAFLLYSSLSDDDVDMVVDMDTSDAGGLVWRVFDTSNFYDLVVCDASSASPNQAVLYRVAFNGRTTLATVSLSWVRGTPHRIRVTMLGPTITVSFDGTLLLTYTDNHPLGPGQCGLRNNTYGGQSAATFYFFSVQAQGDSVLSTTVFPRTRLVSTDPTATPQLTDLALSVRSPDIGSGAFIPSTTYSVLNGSTNTLAQDFDDLARQSNYWQRIDLNKAMKFQAHNGTLAPWILTLGDLILRFGLTVKNAGDLYRNVPWILGGTDTILSDKETFKTDGVMQTFTVDYPIESLVSISAGAASYTFGVKGVDVGKDFYYQVGNNTINQDTAETPLPPGLLLHPVYYGQVNVVASAQNAMQIAALAAIDGTSGIVEVAETAQGLNRAGATGLAASRLIKDGQFSQIVSGTTARPGLAVGQLVSLFLPQHQLMDVQLLITDMATRWETDTMRGYSDATPYFTITAVAGPILNSWATTLAQLGR